MNQFQQFAGIMGMEDELQRIDHEHIRNERIIIFAGMEISRCFLIFSCDLLVEKCESYVRTGTG